VRTWKPTDAEQRALDAAVEALSGSSSSFGKAPQVTWYGKYGCALLAWTPRVDEMHLELIGLDRWAFHMHSGPQSRTFGARADIDAPVVLHVAHVRLLDKFKSLAEQFEKLKSLADKFLAKKPDQQKTPAMILAIFTDAIEALSTLSTYKEPEEGKTVPRGGFTAVMAYDGILARDTAWPLLRSVLQVAIESTIESPPPLSQDDGVVVEAMVESPPRHHELFRKTMAQLLLHLAESAVASLESDSTTFTHHANAIMQLLRNAASEGAELADDGVNLDAFGARCVLVRHKLDELVAKRAKKLAEDFKLPPLNWSEIKFTYPVLILPDETTPARGHDGLAASRARAEKELNLLPVSTGECNAALAACMLLRLKLLPEPPP
jgi:hypothetical protein